VSGGAGERAGFALGRRTTRFQRADRTADLNCRDRSRIGSPTRRRTNVDDGERPEGPGGRNQVAWVACSGDFGAIRNRSRSTACK